MNLRTRIEALEKLKPVSIPAEDPEIERRLCQWFYGVDSYQELTDEQLAELETAVREAHGEKI